MAPNTTYMAVGTERGFLGAAITQARGLVLADVSPAVFVYNTINTVLLEASKGLEDYCWLRLRATADEWQNRLKPLGVTPQWAGLFFTFWATFTRNTDPTLFFTPNGFLLFHSPADTMADPAFLGVNYLFSAPLYSHLAQLARQGRIKPLIADLTNPLAIQSIKTHIPYWPVVGLFDFSNLITDIWRFGGDGPLRAALPHLAPIAHPRAVLMSSYFVGFWDPGHTNHPDAKAMQWSYASRYFTEIYKFILTKKPIRLWFSFDTFFMPNPLSHGLQKGVGQ